MKYDISNRIPLFSDTIWLLTTLLLTASVSSTRAEDDVAEGSEREEKVLPIFQVVKFPVS